MLSLLVLITGCMATVMTVMFVLSLTTSLALSTLVQMDDTCGQCSTAVVVNVRHCGDDNNRFYYLMLMMKFSFWGGGVGYICVFGWSRWTVSHLSMCDFRSGLSLEQ